MECGHALSPHAIRTHIEEALQKDPHAVPSCCGIPLPREALEVVLSKEEAELALNRIPTTPETTPTQEFGCSEKDAPSSGLPRSSIPAPPAKSIVPQIPPNRRRYEAISIDSALANEAFKSFRAQEKELFEQVSAFECNQQKALSTHHACSLKRLEVYHKATKEDKMDQVGSRPKVSARLD